MSSTGKQPGAPTITKKAPKKRPRWQRSLIAAGAAVVLLVGGSLGGEALNQAAPQIPDRLPSWLYSLRSLPPWAEVLIILSIGELAFGVAWVILADRQQQVEAAERDEQGQNEQSQLLDEHVDTQIQARETHLIPVIKEVVEALKQQPPTVAPDRETSPRGSIPGGLPRATAFVGRAKTLESLLSDLRSGGTVGVFSLAGMGGVGKTALAAEAVAQLALEPQTFAAGAVWIACEDLRGPEGLAEVWTRVARALDAAEVAALPEMEQQRAALHALLAQRERLLLALDNVDTLEPRPLLETLAVSGHTTLLLTARQAFDLPGLVALPLDILPTEDAQALFVETLRRSSPHQPRPTAADEAALPELVAVLGGLPLAIELTASYTGRQGLELATVHQEMARDGVKAAPFLPAQHQEHRTLMLRFDRSWQALAEAPRRQRLFAGLSLLAGDSFLRAAALTLAMVARGKQSTQAIAAGDLAALVDYALVEALPGERLRLHPLLRDYASKRLAAETKAVQNRLGEAMVAFWLKYASEHCGGAGRSDVETEAPGLLGAMEWAHYHGHNHELLDLVRAVGGAWRTRGRRVEQLRMGTWAVQAAEALGDPGQVRWTLHQLAGMLAELGLNEEARNLFEQALEIAKHLGDPDAEWAEVHEIAELNRKLDRFAEARRGFERTLEFAQQRGNPEAERLAIHQIALLDRDSERLSEARSGFMRALELTLQQGNPIGIASELRDLGITIGRQGESGEGCQLIRTALSIDEWLNDPYCIGVDNRFLAQIKQQQGKTAEALAHYHEALDRFEQVLSPDAENVRADLRRLGEQV